MDERLFEFLSRYSILRPHDLVKCPGDQNLLAGILDEGSYDIVLAHFEKHFKIQLPSGFQEKIKQEYRHSWRPTARYFHKYPERSPHGFSVKLTVGDLTAALECGYWTDDQIYTIPMNWWLF